VTILARRVDTAADTCTNLAHACLHVTTRLARSAAAGLERIAGGPYPALDISLADIADGSPRAPALASLWVRITGAEVEVSNPDAPSDYDETLLLGGLRLDDLIYPALDNSYPPGTRFVSIQGIPGWSFSHQKLFPRSLEDVVLE
jgi:hypothetical protein